MTFQLKGVLKKRARVPVVDVRQLEYLEPSILLQVVLSLQTELKLVFRVMLGGKGQ